MFYGSQVDLKAEKKITTHKLLAAKQIVKIGGFPVKYNHPLGIRVPQFRDLYLILY